MDKRYLHKEFEEKIYRLWDKSGGFSPAKSPKKSSKPFTIIMPPPNANDPLHIGHAMFVTVEDILIRYHRMLGDDTLWLPGADHAGIETQFVYEKRLKEKGKSRFDYDRESLYQLIWKYVQENSDIAVDQLKRIGASADWSRFTFTLDKSVVSQVIDTFKRLHEDKMVYRDLAMVNYCTRCGTAFSELEVNHVKRKTPLYYMKYGPFTLATVRPETKFGDTAVAVNPSDKRYKKWIGKEVEVKGLLGTFKMKVIGDDYVDPEFGTGVIKVTPAHDPNDFEIWKRHKKDIPAPKQVIGFSGQLNHHTDKYEGLYVNQARKQVVEDLKKEGLLVKVDENYEHSVGVCYRCGTVIEPLPMPQFFVRVKPLTKPVLEALSKKQIRVHGSGHDKILKHWLKNLKDWNVSRQIVWGIRIPVWYSIEADENADIEIVFLNKSGSTRKGKLKKLLRECSLAEIKEGLQSLRAPMGAEYVVSPTSPESNSVSHKSNLASLGKNYIQETDTFDTWFSSGQWPFVTLRASPFKNDVERFYPTQVMETAYDILIFWVMRMLMLGMYSTKDDEHPSGIPPFKDVYLHGLIRDEKGKKMSKSKGNVINPLTVIEQHGADALRMALVIRSTPGQDKGVGEGDIRGMRNLTNKIWNAARFIIMTAGNSKSQAPITKQSIEIPNQSGSSHVARSVRDDSPALKSLAGKSNKGSDKKFLKQLNGVVLKVTKQLNDMRVGLAAETVYQEFWHWFCDECIEKSKKGEISSKALLTGLVIFLKLLHPFVPFVTEAVYEELKTEGLVDKDEKLLMNAMWPGRDS